MRTLVASLAILASTAAVQAAGITVHQAGRINIYGLVQAGSQSRPVDVAQEGAYNFAGVVQAVPAGSAAVRQSGGANTAVVGQFAPPSVRAGWGGMP